MTTSITLAEQKAREAHRLRMLEHFHLMLWQLLAAAEISGICFQWRCDTE